MMSAYTAMRIKDVLRTQVVLCVWMWTDNMHDCVHHLQCWVLLLSGLSDLTWKWSVIKAHSLSLEKLFYILVPFRSVWCDLDCTGQWAVAIMATPLFEPDTKRPVQLQVAAKDTWQSRLWWTKCALAAGGIVAPCLHYSGCFLQIMPPQLHHIQIPPTAGSSGMLPITISIIMSLLIIEEAS